MIRSTLQQLIDRYLDGSASPDEERSINGWLDTLAATSPDAGKVLSPAEKEQLRKQLLQAIRHRTGRQKGIRLLWKRTGIAAAVLSLSFAGYLLLRMLSTPAAPAYLVLQTGVGEQKMMTLADSTRIWLAPNSTLQYPENYPRYRSLKLLSGEAFFDVTQNAEKQFSVTADSVDILVLGTAFNVKAYPHQPALQIAVRNGKVKISHGSQPLGILSAGEQMHVNRDDNSIVRTPADTMAIQGWMHSQITFEQTSLQEVLHMLEQYYPVQFTLQQQRPLRISGSLNMQLRIEQVIAVLEELTSNHVTFHQQTAGHYTVK